MERMERMEKDFEWMKRMNDQAGSSSRSSVSPVVQGSQAANGGEWVGARQVQLSPL
jgi:hypothetical protein